MDTHNDAIVERKYIFQNIMFGIYSFIFAGCTPFNMYPGGSGKIPSFFRYPGSPVNQTKISLQDDPEVARIPKN